jgi:branched-chain amino acid transport system substrate-binding protein
MIGWPMPPTKPARPARALLSCLALAASSCAGAPAASTSGSPPPGPGTTRGVTASQIVVGGIATLSSRRGLTMPGADIGAQAYFRRVNAAGGVYGRKIDFVGMLDDDDDPAGDVAAAHQLVERDRVFAVVPVLTLDLAGASFLQQARVPAVGQLYDSAGCQKSYVFGISGCLAPPASERVYSPGVGLVLRQGLFRDPAGKSVAVTADDDPAGHASAQACGAPFSAVGFKLLQPPVFLPVPTVGDFAPYAAQVLHSDSGRPPAVVWTCNQPPTALQVIEALRFFGYRQVAYSPDLYDTRIAADPRLRAALQGSYGYTLYRPVEAPDPALERLRADVAALDPAAQVSTEVLAGYYSAELFVDILRRAGRHLSAESFSAAANRGMSFDARGGLCPVSFPAGHDESSVGGGLVQLVGSAFRVVVPLYCQPISANLRY